MLNAPHIFETALLFLVAFLLGCVIGYLARRLTMPKRVAPESAATETAPATLQPQLVVAPTIAPLPTGKPGTSQDRGRGRSAASRLAAAAEREPDDEPVAVSMPEQATAAPAAQAVPGLEPSNTPTPVASHEMQPARVAGAATSGIVIPSPSLAPVAPPVEPEPAPAAVRAADVPQIDEAIHVVDPPLETSLPNEPVTAEPIPGEPAPVAPIEPPSPVAVEPAPEPPPEPHAPESVILLREPPLSDDDEAAAMRAVEGRSTSRRAAAASRRPVPHPEEVSADVDAAMASARTAVAAATAAATAAIADSNEPAPALDFEPGAASAAESFLEPADDAPEAPAPARGLSFEPLRPRSGYGRPEGLAAPRGGAPDNLKQIKGITPALESSLNGLGIFHFDQVAAWDQKAVIWLDHNLALKGRIGREKWQDQARSLSRGRILPARPVRR